MSSALINPCSTCNCNSPFVSIILCNISYNIELITDCLSKGAKTLDYFISGNRLERWNFEGNIFQKCITLSAVDDVLPEASEFVTVRVSTNDSLVTLDRESVRVYITDNGTALHFSLIHNDIF